MVHVEMNSREICTKIKRKRLVDEEITTNVFVWNSNEFQEADENDHLSSELDKPDPCVRAQNEITLHDRDDIDETDEREHNVRRILFHAGKDDSSYSLYSNHEQVFSQINDFGETFMEPENVMCSPSEGGLSVSEIAESIFSAAHDQEPIEENDTYEANIGGANADGDRVDANDLSCESIPATPTFPMHKPRRKTFGKRIATPEVDVMPEKTSFDPHTVRKNIQPLPIRGLSISRAVKSIPPSPFAKSAILSQPEYLNSSSSQLTDDNNNPPTPNVDDDAPPPQETADDNSRWAEVIEDIQMRAEIFDNFPALLKPNDDIPLEIVSPASPIVPEVDSGTANVDDISNEVDSGTSNVDDLFPPSPPKLEPIDIKPLLEFLQPLAAVSKRKRRSPVKKKKRMIRVDDVITLDSTEMRARIQNVTVDCKRQLADIVSTTEKFLHKEATFFTEPIMFGQCNRIVFKRNLVQNDENYDSSIIKIILNSLENDRPESVENREQERRVIDGDTTSRRRGRKRKSPDVDSRAHQHQHTEMANYEGAALPTPGYSMNGIESQLEANSFVMDVPLPDDSQPVDQRPRITPLPLDEQERLNENLNENDDMVLRKLKGLWKQNGYPVAMTTINLRESSRLQAAMNFASILCNNKLNHN